MNPRARFPFASWPSAARLALSALLLLAPLLMAAPARAAEPFTLEGYFTGRTVATGTFRAINGVRRDFAVDLDGRWDRRRQTLTLVETFRYADGERDRKTWVFRKTAPGRYVGTREDVIGATDVAIAGDTARFAYDVNLDPKGTPNVVRFNDTMTLRPDGTVLNTARVTKWGLPVASTRVEFRR